MMKLLLAMAQDSPLLTLISLFFIPLLIPLNYLCSLCPKKYIIISFLFINFVLAIMLMLSFLLLPFLRIIKSMLLSFVDHVTMVDMNETQIQSQNHGSHSSSSR